MCDLNATRSRERWYHQSFRSKDFSYKYEDSWIQTRIRYAHTCQFLNQDQSVIDIGIAIFFEGPNSYTGEDTLELQCHGSLPLLNEILNRLLSLGAVIARPESLQNDRS